ncbi:tRNA1(Val) (adenine(37)-N6)-methyltransferase [Celeribacter litoreus]|uniref:tRNA1(Val) (adenine(37)-N6)-methyltransferase n=1 Tax=Celeribacter litoreus TaxID=2876714 RepID=UPI001CC9D1C1|nr:methyltransferase [Celeribacter litoreus]MCA0044327.1 methyltransferase [Celeribacter litoreus]
MTQSELSRDAFLGGRVHVFQPKKGYRAGVDPVLLAASVEARPRQSVLELGCGAGTASLCLNSRVPDLKITGVELQPFYADLARKSALENGAPMVVVEADLRALPPEIKETHFDHVIANPPYYERHRSTAATDAGRETALGGDTPLETWFDVAARRLRPKGYLTMIQKVDRLPEMLAACEGRLGSLMVRPIQPRIGRDAELVILRARKGGRAIFRLCAPLIMHEGERHERDGESYCKEVSNILRNGSSLDWPT